MNIRYHPIFYVLAGLMLGFLVLHPYAMLIQLITGSHNSDSVMNSLHAWAYHFFDPGMLPMGFAFALFGGVIGLLVEVVIDKRRRLLRAEHEKAEREIALRTVHDLMVTLSHYLLNANMIIGGKVRHCRKAVVAEDVLDSLNVIEEQGRKIDAVLKTLRNLVEVNTSGYTSKGLVAMIDISRELGKQLGSDLKSTSAVI